MLMFSGMQAFCSMGPTTIPLPTLCLNAGGQEPHVEVAYVLQFQQENMRAPAQTKKSCASVSCLVYSFAVIILCCMGVLLIRVSWYEHGVRKGTPVTAATTNGEPAASESTNHHAMPLLSLDQVSKVAKALDPEVMQNVLPAEVSPTRALFVNATDRKHCLRVLLEHCSLCA